MLQCVYVVICNLEPAIVDSIIFTPKVEKRPARACAAHCRWEQRFLSRMDYHNQRLKNHGYAHRRPGWELNPGPLHYWPGVHHWVGKAGVHARQYFH